MTTDTAIWQEIDTAPKDGCSILLRTVSGMIEGYWWNNRWEQDSICANHYGGTSFESQPTHWANIPDTLRA